MKFLHLFLGESDLFEDIRSFLHIYFRCLLKTHAETVAESMGNLIELHSEKWRGLGVEDAGKETFIDWNGPLFILWTNLVKKLLTEFSKVASGTLSQLSTGLIQKSPEGSSPKKLNFLSFSFSGNVVSIRKYK